MAEDLYVSVFGGASAEDKQRYQKKERAEIERRMNIRRYLKERGDIMSDDTDWSAAYGETMLQNMEFHLSDSDDALNPFAYDDGMGDDRF